MLTLKEIRQKSKFIVICKGCGNFMNYIHDANRYFREEPDAWSCPECSYITEIEEQPEIRRN